MNRRRFITSAYMAACLPVLPVFASVSGKPETRNPKLETRNPKPETRNPKPETVKPIVGSWFEFEHHNQTGAKYWNRALPGFTAEQWKTLVYEMHGIGMEYLVMLSVAYDGKTYYPSSLQPRHDFACADPMEAVLSAADECGIKFFISNDYWDNWRQVEKAMKEEAIWQLREKGMEETAAKYAHHRSFYGWYYPNESELHPVFSDVAVNYINRCSKIAHSLTPGALTMVAPYGTQFIRFNDRYIRQLEGLDIDIIAYQDEIGVQKMNVGEAGRHFEDLYKMHVKAGRARLWADIEVFAFETEIYRSPAVPAPFDRVLRQMADVSPYVEHILMYQYQGMMNKPGTTAFAGHKDSERLYGDYVRWLNGGRVNGWTGWTGDK